MIEVKYITYTQFLGAFDDDNELEEDEEIIEEYETLEQAEREARKNKYGHRGQFVEVFVNNEWFRDYER